MRYLKQFFIILLISMLGELLNLLLPLPVPAAVYGMVLLLLALCLKLLRLEQVETVGSFFLDVMPLIFIPYAVAMLPIWPQLQALLVPLFVISIACTLLVILGAGQVTQLLMRKKGEDNG